jgi:hypothetical protein
MMARLDDWRIVGGRIVGPNLVDMLGAVCSKHRRATISPFSPNCVTALGALKGLPGMAPHTSIHGHREYPSHDEPDGESNQGIFLEILA